MASTNHTSTYQLCQWAENDPVLREDFNADNAKLEAALVAIVNGIAAKEVVFGSYTGMTSSAEQQITLGFRPRYVFVFPSGGNPTPSLASTNVSAQNVRLTQTGFIVNGELNAPAGGATAIAYANPYRYLAMP